MEVLLGEGAQGCSNGCKARDGLALRRVELKVGDSGGRTRKLGHDGGLRRWSALRVPVKPPEFALGRVRAEGRPRGARGREVDPILRRWR